MYKLKYANVRRVVSTEKEKEELIKQGYSLYGQDAEEEEEQPKDEIVEEDMQEIDKEIEEVIQEPTEEEVEDIKEPVEETEEPKEARKGRVRNAK